LWRNIVSDPAIFDKALGEQFDKLIYQPLQKVSFTSGCTTLVVVVDALDECEKNSDIEDYPKSQPSVSSYSLQVVPIYLSCKSSRKYLSTLIMTLFYTMKLPEGRFNMTSLPS
jgi:hypothetical protein